MSIWVNLSPDDLVTASEAADQRNRTQRAAGHVDGKVLTNSVDIDVQGCLGEIAVAKALGLGWDGKIFDYEAWQRWRVSGHDVSGVEVRSTRHLTGRLLLHPRDRDELPFVLVRTMFSPRIQIVGWCWGRDGKKSEWWVDVGYGRPCFFVPNFLLRPIADLVRLLPTDRIAV